MMLSNLVLVAAIGFLWVDATPMMRAEQKVVSELNEIDSDKLEECLEKNGFEDALEDANNGRLDMTKIARITKKCFQEVPELRPLVLTINGVQYISKKSNHDFCGIELNNSSNPVALKSISQKFEQALVDQEKDFCLLTFQDVVPALCQLKKYCKKDQLGDLDALFAIFYSIQQLGRKHPSSFSCRNKNGQDLLANIVNQKAYTDQFVINKDKFLTRPLPCGTKFDGQGGRLTDEKPPTFGQKALNAVKPFVNRSIKKFF